jgi:hypothetical protein
MIINVEVGKLFLKHSLQNHWVKSTELGTNHPLMKLIQVSLNREQSLSSGGDNINVVKKRLDQFLSNKVHIIFS